MQNRQKNKNQEMGQNENSMQENKMANLFRATDGNQIGNGSICCSLNLVDWSNLQIYC